jgi:hypothetical protein
MRLLLPILILLSAQARSEDIAVPTAEEIRKVSKYYYEGKPQGPILVEVKACTKIDFEKTSPTKNECIEEVRGPLPRGTHVHAWTLWMVPEGGQYDDAAIQYVHEGEVHASIDLNLTPALRSRAFRANALTRPGKWEIRVVRKGNILGTVSLTAI